LKQAAN